jgi:hypothetical protein
MTSEEKKFHDIFIDEIFEIKDMSYIELVNHRDEMVAEVFELKARVVATDDRIKKIHAISGIVPEVKS